MVWRSHNRPMPEILRRISEVRFFPLVFPLAALFFFSSIGMLVASVIYLLQTIRADEMEFLNILKNLILLGLSAASFSISIIFFYTGFIKYWHGIVLTISMVMGTKYYVVVDKQSVYVFFLACGILFLVLTFIVRRLKEKEI